MKHLKPLLVKRKNERIKQNTKTENKKFIDKTIEKMKS